MNAAGGWETSGCSQIFDALWCIIHQAFQNKEFTQTKTGEYQNGDGSLTSLVLGGMMFISAGSINNFKFLSSLHGKSPISKSTIRG